MAKKKAETTQSNASIVDGKLILSLPNAQMPVVWQMDLNAAKSASFTVKEDKKKKVFNLVLKKDDGSTDEIAPFEDKQSAVDVLMETSSVLQSGQGKDKADTPANNNATNGNNGSTSKNDKLGAFLAFALIVILFSVWMISASSRLDITDGESVSSSYGAAANPRESSGVPVSADDFLNNR